jgi:hypothetical protein
MEDWKMGNTSITRDVITRNELMTSFAELKSKFDRQKHDIKEKESKFDSLRENLRTNFADRQKGLDKLIGEQNPLRDLVHSQMEHINDIFREWEAQVARRAKGTKFREGFNDSLLVFIYGKVKSGKSSLGNYMAYGHSEPSDEIKSGVKNQPEYFTAEQTTVSSGDKEKEAEKTRQFRVGATEATSSVQGFTLPGLTWVDSPGLHSVNAANGDLAREYADHADMIIYTMHSQAPGRASDMNEIGELLASGKKVMILLTGSDTTDEDEDSAGNLVTTVVMKSARDRNDQIAHVRGELAELLKKLPENSHGVLADILPISTRYAELNPTPEGIAGSGMGTLLLELQTICSSQALNLKLNAPMGKLKDSIRITRNDLTAVDELVTNFRKKIGQQNEDIRQELLGLGIEGRSMMNAYVNQVFSKGTQTDAEKKLPAEFLKVMEQLAGKAFDKIGEKQKEGFKQALAGSQLGKLPEYKEVTETREYVKVKSGNKKKTGLLGAILGGLAGFLAAGPVGAAIGVSLGTVAGRGAGSSASQEYATHDVVVGDNQEDRRQRALKIYASDFPEILNRSVTRCYEPIRKGMLDYCDTIGKEMKVLSRELEQLEK